MEVRITQQAATEFMEGVKKKLGIV